MPGDGLPQRQKALIGKRLQQLLSQVQHHFPLKPVPYGEGKVDRLVGGQVNNGRRSRLRLRIKYRRRGALLHYLHKIADFFLGADISLLQQLVVGILHGDLTGLQMLRQRPLGGQLFPGTQSAGMNIVPNASVQRLIKGNTGRFSQFIGQHGSPFSRSQITSRLPFSTEIFAGRPTK